MNYEKSGKRLSWLIPVVAVFMVQAQRTCADPVFHDNFSTPSQSHQYWIALTVDNQQLSIADGKATLENPSSIYSGFAIHALSSSLPEYSFTAKITSFSAGVGIFCRTGMSDGLMLGYAVVSGDDQLVLLQYREDGPHSLISWSTPFPGQLENQLTLTGDGENIAVFCNGFFQFSCPDTFGNPDGIAVVVPPQGTVTFDDVQVETKMQDTLAFSPFSNSLKELPKYFHRLGNGEIDTVDGAVEMVTGKSEYLYAGLDLPVKDFGMAVSFRFGAVAAGEAGFFFGKKDTLAEEGVVPVFRIGVTAEGEPSVVRVKEDGTSDPVEFSGAASLVDPSGWHRYSLERRNGSISFSVDSVEFAVVASSDSFSFSFGLYTGDSATIRVKDFSCESLNEIVTPVVYTIVGKRNIRKNLPGLYDLTGRVVAVNGMSGFRKRCANGVVVQSGGKKLLLKK